MINKEIIDELVQDLLNKDQTIFHETFKNGYEQEDLAEWYRSLGAEYCSFAKECYNAAWNISDMLQGMSAEKVKEMANSVGVIGLAHHSVGKQYKKIWEDLSGVQDMQTLQ